MKYYVVEAKIPNNQIHLVLSRDFDGGHCFKFSTKASEKRFYTKPKLDDLITKSVLSSLLSISKNATIEIKEIETITNVVQIEEMIINDK